jgi:hypothetical protein
MNPSERPAKLERCMRCNGTEKVPMYTLPNNGCSNKWHRLSEDDLPASSLPEGGEDTLEPKVEDAIRLLRKMEQCTEDATKIVLLRNFCGQVRHFIKQAASSESAAHVIYESPDKSVTFLNPPISAEESAHAQELYKAKYGHTPSPSAPTPEKCPARCSFCHKDQTQVKWLVVTPSDYVKAYICDECIEVCVSLLAERTTADSSAPASTPATCGTVGNYHRFVYHPKPNSTQSSSPLSREAELLTKGCIVEIAVRNPSVADYVRHWEWRAEKAESDLSALRQAAQDLLNAGHQLKQILLANVERGVQFLNGGSKGIAGHCNGNYIVNSLDKRGGVKYI